MLETLRKEGHFREVGASEIKPATLDIMHKVSWPVLTGIPPHDILAWSCGL